MEIERSSLDIKPIKSGWAALGDGWAVHGETVAEAIERYREAVRKHEEIDARSAGSVEEGQARGK